MSATDFINPTRPKYISFPVLPAHSAPLAELAALCNTLVDEFDYAIEASNNGDNVREALIGGTTKARVWAYYRVREGFSAVIRQRREQYYADLEADRLRAQGSPCAVLMHALVQNTLSTVRAELGMDRDIEKTLVEAIKSVQRWEHGSEHTTSKPKAPTRTNPRHAAARALRKERGPIGRHTPAKSARQSSKK